MVILELKQVEVDYCTNCSGIWLDGGELELLLTDENSDDSKKFSLAETFTQIRHSNEKLIKCPVCRKQMGKVSTAHDTKIVIDKCNNEHGLWFDFGELNQMTGSMGSAKNNVFELLNDVFRYKLNQKKGG